MIGHLWKLALVVALSHGSRMVGRTVGPRWAGLITALPCSTAVALLGGGSDRGLNYAVTMANACWVGLAGASALPLAFASATVAGWSLARSVLLGLVTYLVVMMGIVTLGDWLGGPAPAAILFLAGATVLATRVIEPVALVPASGRTFSARQVFWLRTVVPATCLGTAIGLGERLGPGVAGVLGAFPGVTLTTLMLMRLESGPVAAVRMARALPPGNWAMVTFLATFTQVAPTLGLLGSVAVGYVAALACLGTVAHLTDPPTLAHLRRRAVAGRDQIRAGIRQPAAIVSAWPKVPLRFSPLVESAAA